MKKDLPFLKLNLTNINLAKTSLINIYEHLWKLDQLIKAFLLFNGYRNVNIDFSVNKSLDYKQQLILNIKITISTYIANYQFEVLTSINGDDNFLIDLLIINYFQYFLKQQGLNLWDYQSTLKIMINQTKTFVLINNNNQIKFNKIHALCNYLKKTYGNN